MRKKLIKYRNYYVLRYQIDNAKKNVFELFAQPTLCKFIQKKISMINDKF